MTVSGVKYQLFDQHCIQNTHGSHFAASLDSSKFDKVVQKGTDRAEECFSAFRSFGTRRDTGLADWLRQLSVGHVYVVGVALETCVKHTVKDALEYGFLVTLVQDACAPANADSEHAIVQDLLQAGCKMTDLASAVSANQQ